MSSVSKARVLVAEDHSLRNTGIAATIERESDMEIIGLSQDGFEAIARFQALRPDVTVVDLRMTNLAGLGLIEAIRAVEPEARIVALTEAIDDVSIKTALRLGAASVLLKRWCKSHLAETIRAVHRGERPLSEEITAFLAHRRVSESLTPREISVMKRVACGKSNREVAKELEISEYTVKSHVKSVMTKLGANDRTHAAMMAFRKGFFGMDPEKF